MCFAFIVRQSIPCQLQIIVTCNRDYDVKPNELNNKTVYDIMGKLNFDKSGGTSKSIPLNRLTRNCGNALK